MGQKLFTVNADIMPMGGQMESRALTFLCLARLVYKHRQQSCREIPWLDIKHQAVHTVCGLPLKSNRTPLSILQLEVLKKTILNQLPNSHRAGRMMALNKVRDALHQVLTLPETSLASVSTKFTILF